MKNTLTTDDIATYLARQLTNFFPDREVTPAELRPHVGVALERLEHCFLNVRRRGYFDGLQATFDHLHTDQYASFLWFVGNTIHIASGDRRLAVKSYALNKALHGLDVFFEVGMPEIFCFQHPVGTVIGRAKALGNHLFVYQNVNIGGSIDLEYPSLGEGVVLFNGATVSGPTTIGDNVWLGPQCNVKGGAIPSSSLVFGSGPNVVVKPTHRSVRAHFFERVPSSPQASP